MAQKYSSEEAERMMLQVGLKPLELYKNSHHKWKSECQVCGELNEKPLRSVLKNKLGCVFCGEKKINSEKASMRMLAKGFATLEPFTKSSSPWKSRCLNCKNIVSPSYKYVVTQNGRGCKYCSHTFVSSEDAIQIMLDQGLEPLEPYNGTSTPWKCKCMKCGMISTPTHADVRFYHRQCRYCSGNTITPEFAIEVMQKAGYEPQEPYVSNKTKWKSIHIQCGSVVSPKFNTITTGTGGCRTCATIGYEVGKSAFVYVMKHDDYKSIKVGIGNQDSNPNRIKVHERHGWNVVEVFIFENGWDALNIETAFFTWLRKVKGIKPHLNIGQTPQSGWSETMSAEEISIKQVVSELKKVIKGLSAGRY